MDETLRAALADARAKLDAGDAGAAWTALRGGLPAGPPPTDDTLFVELVTLGGRIARGLGAVAVAERLERCAAAPGDVRALYDGGYALYEEGQHAVAVVLLYRANRLAPGQAAIVSELASCLEALLRYGEAALVVDLSGTPERDDVCAYLSGYAHLLAGDLDVARERLGRLGHVTDRNVVFMRDALAGMVARADTLVAAGVPLDEGALAAWQAAIDGTVLLHLSPHGWPDPMHGRYAYVGDSPGLQREGLERLRLVLAWRGERPPIVRSAPDRASHILGLAAAQVLGLPHEPWREGAGPGLVVAWSLENVGSEPFLRAMSEHRPGERLFVHASSWTEPFPYAPDVTTLLHQSVSHPYTGGAMRWNAETKRVDRAEPDPRDDAVLAAEVAEAVVTDGSRSSPQDLAALVRALAKAPAPHGAGLWRDEGRRLRQRAGSPVPSARFA